MSGYGESRWHEECFGRCGDCPSCVRGNNNNDSLHCSYSKRFVTVGSVRYGLRFGAVSPPPPGAGPRYRSQCCWPSSPGSGPGCVSRIPLLSASPINSPDIFKCVNRLRMAEDATSELGERAAGPVLHNAKSLLRRRALVRPQDYSRLFECGEEGPDIADTLDRLPRFRFGGNRGNSKREKRNNEQRARELPEILKKQPVPPPRVKHVSSRAHLPVPTPEAANDEAQRTLPLRSASFSQVDYSVNDNKYIRRRQASPSDQVTSEDSLGRGSHTLPRLKTPSPKHDVPGQPCDVHADISSVHGLCDIIYRECKNDKVKESLAQMTSELSELQKVEEEPPVSIRNSILPESNDCSIKEKKRDKSRRRKGIYISQWPNTYHSNENLIPQFVEDGDFPLYAATPNANVEIPKLKISEPKPDNFEIWSSPQEEPLSPEENTPTLEWNFDKDMSPNIRGNQLLRADSLSEGEHEQGERKQDQQSLPQSDISDCESKVSIGNDANTSHVPRRYSKRPLRGPYGQMLEAEMKKPEQDRKYQYSNELKFLEDLSAGSGMSTISLSSSSSVGAGDPKPKYVMRCRGASNHSLDDSQLKNNNRGASSASLKHNTSVVKRKVSADSINNEFCEHDQKPIISHQRTTSSPSKLEAYTEVTPELLEQLLKGSSEQLATEANQQRVNDTRTHVVVELYDTERSYVESLQILVTKYLEPLKSPENATLLDSSLVDEIFYQIPSLLNHHQVFLDELKKRLEHWDLKQKVGDVFLDTFSKPSVIESYTNYVNNWKRARDIIKNAQQSKPAFAKFLEAMAREHKGKLALDSLLIKPIQKFPKYELLLQRLIKHTDPTHPDHSLLLAAQREVHDQLLKINCTEREALELEQLREIEGLIEGLIELVSSDRQYLRHDLVTMAAGGGTRKERALFLFSDLLLVTSIKRRSGTIRRPTGQGSVTSTLEANKYKLLMKIPLDDLEIVRSKDENIRQMMLEISNLTDDINILNQINELTWSLHCNHGPLEDTVKEMLVNLNKHLAEQQNSDSQLACLDLTLNTSNGLENVSIAFSKPEKRASWEESFNEAKHKLAISGDRRPTPELVATVPIRKTRAGLQFTCAAPTLGDNGRDVWVCNSDGYVGQVCILSLHPEPTVTSCNGVCNARILCIVSVPGINSNSCTNSRRNTRCENDEHNTIQFDSSSSSDEYERSDPDEPSDLAKSSGAAKSSETVSTDSDETDTLQSTMWLGTEDGCIHVYNSSDNIRIKKNKIKLQHSASILCIIYLENKVFVSLANGDLTIYERDSCGGWNVNTPLTVSVGTTTMPVAKILPNGGKLWCGCGNTIKVFNTQTLTSENSFIVNNDSNKHITSMVLSGNGVWLSLQNSAIVKCFHAQSCELLGEVNVAPAVTKMLTSCDDIIRQHKAACLRVTSLLACKDLLWVGTSAGVLLTMPIPHITPSTSKLGCVPTVIGIPHGHTGHVRFLTQVECQGVNSDSSQQHHHIHKGKQDQRNSTKILVISGGDGYEDFRSSNVSEVAGREDSTNHLLLWNI